MEYVQIYKNILYNEKIDDYKFIGMQETFRETSRFPLYSGVKYHRKISLDTILIIRRLEDILSKE